MYLEMMKVLFLDNLTWPPSNLLSNFFGPLKKFTGTQPSQVVMEERELSSFYELVELASSSSLTSSLS